MDAAKTPSNRHPTNFRGFDHIDANYIYCPNQFFDVCLPTQSRSAIRLVAYILRRTLGYLDRDGNPVTEDVTVSYRELTQKAGISTRAIPEAIAEALAGGFITCVRAGRRDQSGQRGQTAQYALRWAPDDELFTRTPDCFAGFFSGDGNRTPIPNGYFDVLVPGETLAVIKVVGTVLRHTVGYRAKFGGKRSSAPLSHSYIQTATNLKHRPTLSMALHDAIKRGYIRCAEVGYFDPNAGRASRPARYAINWLDKANKSLTTAKSEPATKDHGRNRTETTAKTEPREDGKNRTDRKTNKKDNFKQQNVVADSADGFELLVREGITESSARKLAATTSLDEIRNQITWLEFRKPGNRPAMLRKAIEEGWSKPDGVISEQKHTRVREHDEQQRVVEAARETAIYEQKKQRQMRRDQLLTRWRSYSVAEQQRFRQIAQDNAASKLSRQLIMKCSLADPTLDILEAMATSPVNLVAK